MALTFDSVVDEARARVPEVSQVRAVQFANARLNRMIAEAQWRNKVATLTTTVADQSAYALTSDLIDIRRAWIGTARYDLSSYDEIRNVEDGLRGYSLDTSDGATGVVASYYDSSGNPSIYFYPAPDTSGSNITIEVAYQGADITYGASSTTILPADFLGFLQDGVLAEAYEAEGRFDEAQPHNDRYETGIEKLRRRKNSRVGSGVQRIRLVR